MFRCITSATPRRYHLQPVRDRVASANTSVARVALPRSKLTSLLLRSWQRPESHREAETSIFSWQRNRQGTHCRCHFYRKTRGKRSERSSNKGRNSTAENMRNISVELGEPRIIYQHHGQAEYWNWKTGKRSNFYNLGRSLSHPFTTNYDSGGSKTVALLF